MKPQTLICSLLAGALLSFSAQATDFIDVDDFPQWFQDAMAREGNLKGSTKLAIPELGIEQEVRGQYTVIESDDGTWAYQVDIGSDFPATCYVFSEYDGYATSLYAILDFSLTSVEEAYNKSINSRFNYSIDSGVIGNIPYLAYDVFYSIGEGEDKSSGVIKSMVAETANSLQICVHNELGFRETFFNSVESFIQAFINSDQNDYFYEAVYEMSINGIDVGFAHETYRKDEDGDVHAVDTSALLVSVDASTVARSDTVTNTWSRPDGSLINAQEVTIENGAVTSSFAISYNDDKWQVSGELQGKEINTSLQHTGWLLTGFGSYDEVRILRESEQTSAPFHMWVPSADPTLAIPVTLRTIEDNPKANLELDMGVMTIKFLADERTIFQNTDIVRGPMNLNMRLIYSNGVPVLP